jgi:hypothetical protein
MSWSPGGDLLAVGGYDQVRPVLHATQWPLHGLHLVGRIAAGPLLYAIAAAGSMLVLVPTHESSFVAQISYGISAS